MPKVHRSPINPSRRLATLVALVMAVTSWLTLSSAVPASAAQTQITDGSMTWGMKASWRAYTGTGDLSEGVTLNSSDEYVFPLVDGQYDSEARSTTLSYKGSVHWKNHYYPNETHVLQPPAGYTGPLDIYVLDVTISDPQVTITSEGSTLTAHVVYRDRGWALHDGGRIEFADLDVSGITPSDEAGATTWTAMPASLTEVAANDVFGGQYKPAQAIDPVNVTYTGPGGAPDFSEQWDAPGAPDINLDTNTVLFDGTSNSLAPWWNDTEHGIIHARKSSGGTTLFAFDAATMQQLGQSTNLAIESYSPAFVDTQRQRAYYRSAGSTIDSYVQWNPSTATYSQHTLAAPVSTTAGVDSLLWDTQRRVGYATIRQVPDGVDELDFDQHLWKLIVVTETGDGTFSEKQLNLPNGPTGWNADWNVLSGTGLLSDGSILLPSSLVPDGPDPAVIDEFFARRLVISAENATLSDVPGTGTAEPRYMTVIADQNGRAALIYPTGGGSTTVRQFELDENGELVTVGDELSLGNLNARAFTFDPTNGTLWAHALASQELVMIRDGQLVGTHKEALLNIRAPFIWVGTDHKIVVASSDGQPYSFIKPYKYGFASFGLDGFAPTVSEQPQNTTVTLQQDEVDGDATFNVEFTGTPTPTVQWQAKAPGKSRFVDVNGATNASLTVTAGRSADGTQYRAVGSSSAGRLATEVATLDVDSAPTFGVGLASQRVTAGADAVFSVLASGAPEPEIQWQRRVNGFWQNVTTDDDDFAVTDGSLTVKGTNIDQSGATFRARARNSVATVHSKTVTLTVVPPVEIPEDGLDLDGVSLEWSGSTELQKAPPSGGSNYFSAGVSDGSENTFKGSDGEVKVLQVSADGDRAETTWNTRAAHIGGGTQLVRLGGGHAHLKADGSATVAWDGAFSVNFYGGMVPFTVTDPELAVDEAGAGTLTGDLSGYASTQQNPGQRTPLTPVPDVTIATFDGVEIDPAGKVTITPDYNQVEIDVPTGHTAQKTDAEGWGAWPQEFVDFHFGTGLSSYWYSSGGAADPLKKAMPFAVDFTDATPAAPVAEIKSTTSVELGRSSYAYGSYTTASIRVTAGGAQPSGSVTIAAAGKTITAPLVAGLATVDLPRAIKPGRYPITVDYPGAGDVLGSSATASFSVTKATPSVSAKLLRSAVKTRQKAKVKLVVTIPGGSSVPATGQVVIRDGGKVIKTRKLYAGHHGKVTITLPKLSKGKHYLRATIRATNLQTSRTTGYKKLTVT